MKTPMIAAAVATKISSGKSPMPRWPSHSQSGKALAMSPSPEAIGREQGVHFGVGFLPERRHEALELGIALGAARAVGAVSDQHTRPLRARRRDRWVQRP